MASQWQPQDIELETKTGGNKSCLLESQPNKQSLRIHVSPSPFIFPEISPLFSPCTANLFSSACWKPLWFWRSPAFILNASNVLSFNEYSKYPLSQSSWSVSTKQWEPFGYHLLMCPRPWKPQPPCPQPLSEVRAPRGVVFWPLLVLVSVLCLFTSSEMFDLI